MTRSTSPALLALLALLGACSVETTYDSYDELADFNPFAPPVLYTVSPGDTLGAIATEYGVTADDLRDWNGIEGDDIDVDQVLLVWKGHGTATPKAVARRRGTVEAEPAPLIVEAALVEIRPDRPPPPKLRPHGVFGAMDEAGLSDDLDGVREATAGMERYDGASDGSGPWDARGEGLADGGAAEANTATPSTRAHLAPDPYATASFGGSAVYAPNLPDPPRKRCLAGPTDVSGDDGIAAGMGLTASQIRSALGGFVRHTAACVPSGSSGTVTVTTSLTVGCDGRVREAQTVSSGGAPASVARCVAEILTKAPFPAHDLPDGMTFHYPVTLSF